MLKAAMALITTVISVVAVATVKLLRMLVSSPSRTMTREKFSSVSCRGK
jgi:hypothetical protein